MICILIAEHLQLFALLSVLCSASPNIVLHASESDGAFLIRACLDSTDCQHLSHLKSVALKWLQDLGKARDTGLLLHQCIACLAGCISNSRVPIHCACTQVE